MGDMPPAVTAENRLVRSEPVLQTRPDLVEKVESGLALLGGVDAVEHGCGACFEKQVNRTGHFMQVPYTETASGLNTIPGAGNRIQKGLERKLHGALASLNAEQAVGVEPEADECGVDRLAAAFTVQRSPGITGSYTDFIEKKPAFLLTRQGLGRKRSCRKDKDTLPEKGKAGVKYGGSW